MTNGNCIFLAGLSAGDPGGNWFQMDSVNDSVGGSKLQYLCGAFYGDTSGWKPLLESSWVNSAEEVPSAADRGWIG